MEKEYLCDREQVIQLVDAYDGLVHELGRVYYLQDMVAIDACMAEVDRLRALMGLDDD